MTGRGGQSGFSLLDVTIALALVAVVIGVAYPGFKVANDTMATSGRRDRLERAADRALAGIVEAVRAGRIDAALPPDAPPSLTIRTPRPDTALEELDADGNVPWQETGVMLRFRTIEEFREEVAGQDLNRDGDRDDVFALGVLEVLDGGAVRHLTGNARAVLALPTYAGDLDGDGGDDPLFAVEDRSLEVRLTLASRDESGRLRTTAVRRTIRLRNQQE